MQRPISPFELLALADELGGRGGGPGRPRTIRLRAAESSAYYALFHQFGLAVATHLLPRGSDEDRARLTRSLQHNALKRVCGWVARGEPSPNHVSPLLPLIRAQQEFVDVADAYLELRERRHAADYDHLADLTKAGTLSLIDSAHHAVETLDDLARRGSGPFHLLIALVALASTIS